MVATCKKVSGVVDTCVHNNRRHFCQLTFGAQDCTVRSSCTYSFDYNNTHLSHMIESLLQIQNSEEGNFI